MSGESGLISLSPLPTPHAIPPCFFTPVQRSNLKKHRKNKQPTQIHHYVPQFLLKNFSYGKKHHIWVLDKHTDRKFPSNVKNIACEKGFYDFTENGINASTEPFLSAVETDAAPIIRKIIQTRSLASIDTTMKHQLSRFLATQFIRTRKHLETRRDLTSLAEAQLLQFPLDPSNVRGFQPFNEQEARMDIALSLRSLADQYAPFFNDKSWLLFQTDKRNPFLISDQPITLHNRTPSGPLGTLGLGVIEIEIYFPLSPFLTLAMFCPTIEAQLRQAYRNIYQPLSPILPTAAAKLPPGTLENFASLVAAFDTGNSVPNPPSNVTLTNSLQVYQSFRFLFSNVEDFSFARRMIKEDPTCREGMKPVSSSK